jgi:glycosyltransferase involved in cell wall biosynthesis
MRIAVVVNNYNYARFLDGCLASVFAQARPPDEIVVVDDGSTDDSVARLRAIAADAPRPVTVVAQRNGGQLSAFRAGLAATTCDVLCLLDADDLYAPGHVAAVEAAFTAHPGTQLLFSALTKRFADGRTREYPLPEGPLRPQALETVVLLRYAGWPTSTIAVRGAMARLLDGADAAAWRVSADAVLVMRAAARGLPRRTTAANTVVYRIHGGNLFHGRRAGRAARARLRTAFLHLLADDRAAFAALAPALRLRMFREELAAAPRTALTAYRFAQLVGALPAGPRDRAAMAGRYLAWLAFGGRP